MTQLDWGFDQGEVTYPDDWPDIPEGFELEETTNFRGGGDEFVFTSDLLDLRISTHEDVISATVRVGENLRDYRWESRGDALDWLCDLFELYEKSVLVKIEDVDPMNRVVGVREDYSLISCDPEGGLFGEKSDGLVTGYEDLTNLGDYREWVIHKPENIGDLKFIVSFDNNSDAYMYVFENHIIEIHDLPIGKNVNAFGIPRYQIVFEYLEDCQEEIDLGYLDESVAEEDIVKRFI